MKAYLLTRVFIISHLFNPATAIGQGAEPQPHVRIITELHKNAKKRVIALQPRGNEILVDTAYNLKTRTFTGPLVLFFFIIFTEILS